MSVAITRPNSSQRPMLCIMSKKPYLKVSLTLFHSPLGNSLNS